MFVKSIAAAAVMTVAVSANAALITSFENSGGPGGASYSDSIGVTHGSYSLMVPSPGAWANPTIFSQKIAGELLKDNPILQMDITVPGEPEDSGWMQIGFGIQGNGFADGTGFKQSPWLHDGKPGVAGFSKTLSWDLSAYMATYDPSVATWVNVAIVHQGGGNASRIIYVDNMQATAVPEPVSMGLMGLASLGLLRRVRKD